MQDVWYLVSLMPVVKDGDTYKIYSRMDDTCDYVENEHTGVRYEMSYMDVSGGRNDKNYIPEIKPGESVTVHLAFKKGFRYYVEKGINRYIPGGHRS